jgi:hypothetical protein
MKRHSHRYLPDLPSRILFLVFCEIYFLRFGQTLSISKPLVILTHGLKPLLLLLFARQ